MEQKKIFRQNTEIDLKQMKRKFYQKKQPNFNHIIIQHKKQTRFQKSQKKYMPNSIFKPFLCSFS